MPVTLNLCTVPGFIEHHGSYASKTLEVFGGSLAQETVAVTTVTDIRTAVQAFAKRVRAAHPSASFMVSISLRRGDRKPRGYDTTYLQNGFGQEDFMHVVDKYKTLAAEPSDAGAATAILLQAHDDARDADRNLVVLPDGQARTIDPADVVSNRVFCILLNDDGEEVREIEADCPESEPDVDRTNTTEPRP